MLGLNVDVEPAAVAVGVVVWAVEGAAAAAGKVL